MMRKLLCSFLFFISNSSKKTFKPGLGLLCVGMFFVSSLMSAQTWLGSVSSDWNTAGNWSPNGVPANTANIVIPTVTSPNAYPVLTPNRTCRSITFAGNNPFLTVNAGVTLTVTGSGGTSTPSAGAIIVESSNSSSRNVTIAGGGTLACISFNVGNVSSPNTNNPTTNVFSTISNLNISGDLTILSRTNGSNTNNATFYLESGIVNLNERLTTNNDSG